MSSVSLMENWGSVKPKVLASRRNSSAFATVSPGGSIAFWFRVKKKCPQENIMSSCSAAMVAGSRMSA